LTYSFADAVSLDANFAEDFTAVQLVVAIAPHHPKWKFLHS
jgi:hypothetical protein